MKVILTQDVYKHGVTGEVVRVADGFARNWLIPKKMAIPATQENLKKMGDLRAQAEQNRAVYNEKVNEAARQIDGVELVFGVKAGGNNKLYGSITSQMIKDALMKQTGLDINRRRISDRPIRELGRYEVPVRMGEVSPVLQIVVLREEEVGPYMASKGQGAEAAEIVPVPEGMPVDLLGEVPAQEVTGEAPAEASGEPPAPATNE
jgi:large subunit ribosomal protein L9